MIHVYSYKQTEPPSVRCDNCNEFVKEFYVLSIDDTKQSIILRFCKNCMKDLDNNIHGLLCSIEHEQREE